METCCPEVSLRGQASITKTPIEKVNLLDSKGVWEGNCKSLDGITAGPSTTRYPGFPVEVGGSGKLHARFFAERRTRSIDQRIEAGNPGTRSGRDDNSLVVLTFPMINLRVVQFSLNLPQAS
jgi:hypothetical protein